MLAVDNLSGTRVAGRIIRVEHVDDYKLKRKEASSFVSSDTPPAPVALTPPSWRIALGRTPIFGGLSLMVTGWCFQSSPL